MKNWLIYHFVVLYNIDIQTFYVYDRVSPSTFLLEV